APGIRGGPPGPGARHAVMDRSRRLRIVCGAMALSVVMVNVVLTVLWLSGSLPPKPQPQAVPLAIFALSLVLLVAAPSVKRAILKRYEAEGFEGSRDRLLAALSTATIVA